MPNYWRNQGLGSSAADGTEQLPHPACETHHAPELYGSAYI